jgi:ABC-2 type transport system ATP-binding protein
VRTDPGFAVPAPVTSVAPAIVAEQLSKWYGPRLAVDRVSLEVEAGEVMGLLGPNGSGKTTILRILTGYLRPSAGQARVAGVDLLDHPLTARQRVGYVPEEVPLYDSMRVREFLAFMARLKGLSRAAAPAAVAAVCDRLGLGPVMRLQIGKLSRGFRQRVAIAQALLNRPEILILDEPTNGLDPRQIIEMRDLIRSLAGTHTVLVASHILGEIERVADRVAILLEGRLLAVHPLRAPRPGRRLRLRVRGAVDRVRRCLGAVPGVTAVAVAPGAEGDLRTYVAEVESPGAGEALVAALAREGLALAELAEETVDLEALFLALTGAGHATERPAGSA